MSYTLSFRMVLYMTSWEGTFRKEMSLTRCGDGLLHICRLGFLQAGVCVWYVILGTARREGAVSSWIMDGLGSSSAEL